MADLSNMPKVSGLATAALSGLTDEEWQDFKAAEDQRRIYARFPQWSREAVDQLAAILLPPSQHLTHARREEAIHWLIENLEPKEQSE